jgi:REP element-mobilizing transposase RayT
MGNDKKKTIATIPPDINPMGKKTLSEIIRWFKGRTTYDIHQNEDMSFMWQRSFHDKIIKNNKELEKVRQYIHNNPQQWEWDRNNPKFKGEWITGKTNVLK